MALEPEAYGAGLGRMELKPIGQPLGFRPFDLSFKFANPSVHVVRTFSWC
jgi:hypothetical protein